MSYNQSNGQYSITLTDKNGTASVTKASDVIVSNSNVKVSVSGKKITFTCSKNLGTTVNVTMKNSFLKEYGIKSKNSLYLITSNDSASYQTFARGSNYAVKDGYVKLTFPDVVKLQLHKSSSNKELTAGNGCYSLSGAEYGIYTDKACTKKSAVLQQMQAVTAVTVNMLTHQLLTMQKKQKHQKAMSLTKLFIHL